MSFSKRAFQIVIVFFIISGYSASALLAIIFAIPFGLQILIHKDSGRWHNFSEAFYSAYLELFLGNGCLGVGVIMLLVLTIERYVSVCHPSHMRPALGPPRWAYNAFKFFHNSTSFNSCSFADWPLCWYQ